MDGDEVQQHDELVLHDDDSYDGGLLVQHDVHDDALDDALCEQHDEYHGQLHHD